MSRHLTATITLVITVLALWAFVFDRWQITDWATPVSYHGDSLYALGLIKVASDGDLNPIGYIHPTALGAPFKANWNDFPVPERALYWLAGLLSRSVGLGLAANIAVLCAHLIAALSFYAACRLWHISRPIAWALAIPYAFTPYILCRSLPHLGLTFYGLLPLQLYTCWYLASNIHIPAQSTRYRLSVLVAALTGFLSIYYTFLFLQLLVFALVRRLLVFKTRNITRALVPILATGGSMAVALGSYLLYKFTHGENPGAIVRDFGGLEMVALKPLDLVLPLRGQALGWFDSIHSEYAARSALILMESNTAYIGLIGVFGLAVLFLRTVRNQLEGRPLPTAAMAVAWVIAYSSFGGLNALSGLLTKIYLFRGTNRYSIAVATIALLYVALRLHRWTAHWRVAPRALLAGSIAAVGLVDQSRPAFDHYRKSAAAVSAVVDSDRALVKQLESVLPLQSMVFLLPVADFPESPPIHRMADYEHFRPYFYSHHLRFSYGTNKGRAIDNWQHEVGSMRPQEMVVALENYGFAGILINRKGYIDDAVKMMADFARINLKPEIEQGDWLFYRIAPSASSSLPRVSFAFAGKWMARETSDSAWWHWTAQKAGCSVALAASADGRYRAHFLLGSISKRKVAISINGVQVHTSIFEAAGEQEVSLNLDLSAGEHLLEFASDQPAVSANNGDPRVFTFFVKDFRINH